MNVPNTEKQTKILVTGGTGLVGSAIQWAIRNVSGTFGKGQNEEWVFLSSADANLRSGRHQPQGISNLTSLGTMTRQNQFLTNISLTMSFIFPPAWVVFLRMHHEWQILCAITCIWTRMCCAFATNWV